MDLERILRVTDNNGQWRRTIHGAVNPHTEDDIGQVTQCSNWLISWRQTFL